MPKHNVSDSELKTKVQLLVIKNTNKLTEAYNRGDKDFSLDGHVKDILRLVHKERQAAEYEAYGNVMAHLRRRVRYVKEYGLDVTQKDLQRQARVIQNHKNQLMKWLEIQRKNIAGLTNKEEK